MSGRSSSEKRISKELVNLQKEPPPGCAATLKVLFDLQPLHAKKFSFQDKSVFEWVATVEGPPASPYQVLTSCPLQQYHFWFTSNDAEWKAIKPNIVKFLDIFNFAIFAFKSVLLQGGTFILDIAFPRGFKLIPYLENYLNILSMAASKCSLSRVPLQTTNSRLPYKDLSLQHQLQGRKEKVC